MLYLSLTELSLNIYLKISYFYLYNNTNNNKYLYDVSNQCIEDSWVK